MDASDKQPFDIVIIGSGVGGGILAADLLEKNKKLASNTSYFTPDSTTPIYTLPRPSKGPGRSTEPVHDKSLRILVIERGGLLFNSHCLNSARPTGLGKYGQANDFFFHQFKSEFKTDTATTQSKEWVGGPVFTLGGRSTVWGLFAPR